ncbi:uncharacterized protein LOC134543280 [Bacillus rossius redtenbacheri]|uniref:uncharacterized protein LOC134543280 n=1 Tax=Bacillus rossius redtenbacheri TaxID=93214 RepID=UPI002FDE68DE
MSPESSRLKALSAESLRSVSPGSDSVFYSESADHSSNTVTATDGQAPLCHHCGREVDKATLSGVEDVDHLAAEGPDTDQHDIVQPPAGFADSPEGPRGTKPPGQAGGRLYKKLEKRFRSEERGCHGERRHHSRFRCEGARAKSEERGKEDRVKVRPLTRSTDASLEMLRATDSSPNMGQDNSLSDHTGGDDDDDDMGVYADSYKNSTWIYISDSEEIHVWQKPDSKIDEKADANEDAQDGQVSRRGSAESTSSEREFRRKYQAITHRMVHRKSSVEMYKRLQSKSFGWGVPAENSPARPLQPASHHGPTFSPSLIQPPAVPPCATRRDDRELRLSACRKHSPTPLHVVHCSRIAARDECSASKMVSADASYGVHKTLQNSLEEIIKQMLMIWCKESIAVKLLSSQPSECDKTVVVQRESGEFGFRIHGSRPVVVSAIEPDTPAESSGLEVGDIIISVNSVNVLDASHSEVVKLAHAGSDTLELEVARTCNVLTPVVREPGAASPLYSGFLWKLRKQPGADLKPSGKWMERWFCLKRDNCLYYYKSDSESQPLGALMLANYSVSRSPDAGRPHSFQLWRDGAAGLWLAAESEESATRWVAVISHSVERNSQMDEWLDISKRNLKLSPSCIQQPDCFGYLMRLGVKWKTWRRRYCILKDACLYIYQDSAAESAQGMVCLHGYRVQNSNTGGKRFAFEIVSSDNHQRHFYFHTDTEMDRKRWVAALEYSIDRWIKVG